MFLRAQGAGAQPLPLRGMGFWNGARMICFVVGEEDRIKKDSVSMLVYIVFFPFSSVSSTSAVSLKVRIQIESNLLESQAHQVDR